jgi:hypothetical protein
MSEVQHERPAGIMDGPVVELPAPVEQPATDKTANEVFESLNGFEEIAISQHFNATVARLAENNETIFLRALLFTELVRAGKSPKDAKHEAMHWPIRDVKAFFPDEPDDVMPEEPDSESGKDGSPLASMPTT